MSTILPTSSLAQPFALSTTFLDELQAAAPLAALAALPLTPLTAESLPPAASTEVDLSPVAQFQSALAQSHQLLDELQTPAGAPASSTQQLNGADQLNTLTDAAQNLVAAFNLLQTDNPTVSTPAAALAEAPLLGNLLLSVTQPHPAADASQAAGPATLADIGITLQPAPAVDAGASLTLNAQTLQTAYAANPQGTVALLNQTTDTFEQLGDQYAVQASDIASLNAAPPAVVAANNLVSQSSLADLALLDAFTGTTSATSSGGNIDTLSEQLAVIQEEQLTQQQLDIARDAYTAQTAALLAQTQATQLSNAQLAATLQLSTDQAARLAQQSSAAQQAGVVTASQQSAAAASAAQQAGATQLAAAQTAQAAAAAAQTAADNAAAVQAADLQSTQQAADDQAAATALADAQNAAAAQAAAAATQSGATTAQQAATATAETSATPANAIPANTDPFSTNPVLAAAIAAYRLGGAAAVATRALPTPAIRPDIVPKVGPVDAADTAPPS